MTKGELNWTVATLVISMVALALVLGMFYKNYSKAKMINECATQGGECRPACLISEVSIGKQSCEDDGICCISVSQRCKGECKEKCEEKETDTGRKDCEKGICCETVR